MQDLLRELCGFNPSDYWIREIPFDSQKNAQRKDFPIPFQPVDELFECIKNQIRLQKSSCPEVNSCQFYMLYGMPGCGKTHAAFAVAQYAFENSSLPVYYLHPADLRHSHYGITDKRIDAVFQEIQNHAAEFPLVILDDFDALYPSYGSSIYRSRNIAYTEQQFVSVLETLKNYGITFIALTNQPWNTHTTMRNCARLLYMPLPDQAQRVQFLQQMRPYLDRDESTAQAIIMQCAQKLEWANYRVLNHLVSQFASAAFFNTVEKYPNDFNISTFEPVTESQILKFLDEEIRSICQDKEHLTSYIERMQNLDQWNSASNKTI